MSSLKSNRLTRRTVPKKKRTDIWSGRKRILAYVIISLISCSNCFIYCQAVSNTLDQKIIDYIRRDLSHKLQINLDTVSFIKIDSQESIHLEDFSAGVIADRYVPGFSYENSEQRKKYKDLIARVQDSLKLESDNLNKRCPIPETPFENLNQAAGIFYLYFSVRCDNKMQVVAVYSKAITILNEKRDIYGTAYLYLFGYLDNDIKQHYSSTIEYN